MSCEDCQLNSTVETLYIVAADLGEGAFLKILCEQCWHRRKYRAALQARQDKQRARRRAIARWQSTT
jgi:hypothetical protein